MNYSTLLKHLTTNIIVVFLFSSIQVYSQAELDSIQTVQSSDSVFVMEKSAWGSVLRSAVIPGWGQYYNDAYWKIPIVWGFITYFGSVWSNQHNLYWEFKEKILTDPANAAQYRRNRNFYRNQRDQFAVYLGLTYLLNLVDAYVDAHLFDFNVSADFMTNQPQINIRLQLK
ncbi:MAG: hypothetical protein CVV23_14990 [Ignavibacteriae bacterium HGW-Ignavibacteriae-2]|nr:MAG: hypothetical protein CVV23_14990 [Ignavibacteriae bacterium HGW-Ignavibacteriae-2]